MEESALIFFEMHKKAFLALHLIGVALGMGGATITDILFFNFLRDFNISKKEAEVMRILSTVIMVALSILLVSGAALYLSDPMRLGTSPAFVAKAIIVIILTINGVLMHKFVAPHMIKFSFIHHPIHALKEMHTMRGIAFAMGSVSFVSWYTVFFISMLKSYIPTDTSVMGIFRWYVFALLGALCASQILHKHVHRKSLLKHRK